VAGSAEPVKALAPGESARISSVRTNPTTSASSTRWTVREGTQAAEPNKPPYKPELASKVQPAVRQAQFNDRRFTASRSACHAWGAQPGRATPGLVVLL